MSRTSASLILAVLALAGGMWSAMGDTVAWTPKRGSLDKAGFTNGPSVYRVMSAEDVELTFKMTHVATSPGLFTYSKWSIDRWGDPEGVVSSPAGSWQSVGNAANAVSLDFWGYWGNGGSPLTAGAQTAYEIEIAFERPVEDLTFQLNAINALVTDGGNNAFDRVTLSSFLDGVGQPSPVYANAGDGFIRSGDTLTGDFAAPIGDDTGITSTSDEGSVLVSFPQVIDRVVLSFVCEAQHPQAGSFQDAVQNWSFSLGDLNFEPLAAQNRSTLSWESKRGTLTKPGYDESTATFQAASDDDEVTVQFTLEGLGTTDDKFSYSQWEIDRWGDPTGLVTDPPGSWQLVSNGFNDVVLGLWGYWGTTGEAGAPPVAIGDQTSYRLTMNFDQPVSDLRFQLNAINALLSGGFNAFDTMTVSGSLGSAGSVAPTFTDAGTGFVQTGNVLTGDFAVQIGGGFPNVTDDGSVEVRFPDALDKVVLTFICEADHPQPAQFQGGLQNWSFSIGDLSFLPGVATEIVWAPRQGQLIKPGFNNGPATYQAGSTEGGVTATFDLTHVATSNDRFSYSQWEIHRWGDPQSLALPLGSWQTVSNGSNDIVLGLWGYWGGDSPLAIGDQTEYQLAITFDQPVRNLNFALNGINALIKEVDGFNSFDILTLTSFLGSTPQGAPTYSQEGNAFIRVGNTFTGDFTNQISGVYGGQHVSDAGSVRVRFQETIDKVVLNLVNRAAHPIPTSFQSGQQTWSFSLGDLSFDYDGSGATQQLQRSDDLPSHHMSRREHLHVSATTRGDLMLTLPDQLPFQGSWHVESSQDLVHWERWTTPGPVRTGTQWRIPAEDLRDADQRFFRLAPAGLD